jgi:RNA polymerase sigma-70 factor (ECF subfamily)
MDAAQESAETIPRSHPSRWSLARRDTSEAGRTALHELAAAWWYPAYAYLRACDLPPADATARLESLLAALTAADVAAGQPRFREHLLLLAQEAAIEIEPRAPVIAIDSAWAEPRFLREPQRAPADVFQRCWSLTALDFTLATLESEYAARGAAAQFQHLRAFLGFSASDAEHYEKASAALGLSLSAVRVAVFELRKRYREQLRAQIADTVAHPADIDPESIVLFCGLG